MLVHALILCRIRERRPLPDYEACPSNVQRRPPQHLPVVRLVGIVGIITRKQLHNKQPLD